MSNSFVSPEEGEILEARRLAQQAPDPSSDVKLSMKMALPTIRALQLFGVAVCLSVFSLFFLFGEGTRAHPGMQRQRDWTIAAPLLLASTLLVLLGIWMLRARPPSGPPQPKIEASRDDSSKLLLKVVFLVLAIGLPLLIILFYVANEMIQNQIMRR
jgi:H+/Cl- antiporter ClcA